MSLAEVAAKIVKAVFQNKWLAIEYKNRQGERTSYWAGINDIDVATGRFAADGLHLTSAHCAQRDDGLHHLHSFGRNYRRKLA